MGCSKILRRGKGLQVCRIFFIGSFGFFLYLYWVPVGFRLGSEGVLDRFRVLKTPATLLFTIQVVCSCFLRLIFRRISSAMLTALPKANSEIIYFILLLSGK